MPPTPNKFYLTTPIYYVNARPHIGHAYSTIAADVIARRHRLLGDDTFFLTGTDEHGQKVQRSAEAAGIPPQQFADEVSATFRNLWKRMGITNNDYIRTTDPRHKRGVQHLWKVLEARGAIYPSSYTGQYCVSEEIFVEGPPGTIGPDGKPTETVTEENYFFKLSEYQLPLINLIESGELHIQPETSKNEILSFLRGDFKEIFDDYRQAQIDDPILLEHTEAGDDGIVPAGPDNLGAFRLGEATGKLGRSKNGSFFVKGAIRDLSISRTTFNWGIPVPGNPKHVMYVWLDALANYMTAVGYGSDDPADNAKFARYWPADLHLVGKEITRQHCIYWPAFLMAAGIPLPKSVVANGWLLFEESKMSKSRGNVVRTETILDAFGPLCPPVPASDTAAPEHDAAGPEHDAAGPESLDSTGLQPGESAAKKEGALAPGTSLLAAPTKAQQDLFAADVLRYFLLREIPFGQDGTFSFGALITRYNADLANGYGNLVSRTLSMIEKYCDGRIPPSAYGHIGTTEFIDGIDRVDGTVEGAVEFQHKLFVGLNSYNFSSVLELGQQFIKRVDQYLSDKRPWKLNADVPEERIQRDHILYSAADAVKNITFLLHPFIPVSTAAVWRQLGFEAPIEDITQVPEMVNLRNLKWGGLKPGTKLGPLAPIFPRADKGLAQIMTDMENPTTPSAPISVAALDPTAPTPESLNAVNPTPAEPSTSNLVPSTPSVITIDDFVKIDLRVAQIVVAERIPKADKLLRLEVDLGPNFDPSRRQILSGIAEFYTPEELIGKRIAIIANLAPRKMRGLESHGMLLAASGEDHSSKPILATFSDEIALGSKIR